MSIAANRKSLNIDLNVDPKQLPWITPDVSITASKKALKRILWVRLIKKLSSQLSAIPDTPLMDSSNRSKSCDSLSKEACYI